MLMLRNLIFNNDIKTGFVAGAGFGFWVRVKIRILGLFGMELLFHRFDVAMVVIGMIKAV